MKIVFDTFLPSGTTELFLRACETGKLFSRDLRAHCVQPAVVEPSDNVLDCYMIQCFTDGVVQALPRPHRDLAKLALELRPQLLDRVVVGAIRRQAQDLRSRVLD